MENDVDPFGIDRGDVREAASGHGADEVDDLVLRERVGADQVPNCQLLKKQMFNDA